MEIREDDNGSGHTVYTHVTTREVHRAGSREGRTRVSPWDEGRTIWQLDLRTGPFQQELQGPQRGTLSLRALLGARAR